VVVGSLVRGQDLMEFGGGRNAGVALLVCEVIFLEGEFDGGDGEDVVCSICGGGAEEAAYSMDGIILCNLEVLEDILG